MTPDLSKPTAEGQDAEEDLTVVAHKRIFELEAERDALKRDISMVSHSLKLAYDIREALGWNKYTGLSLMPDEVRRRTADLARMKAAMEETQSLLAVSKSTAALSIIDTALKGTSP